MKLTLFIVLFFILFATPALAQEITSPTPTVAVTEDPSSDIDTSFIGLDDEDLTLDLAGEALPTTNGFAYRWEIIRDNIISVFTFNAEKKATLYQQRLHNLDRKIAACSEVGDPDCVDKVKTRIQRLEQQADRYFARKEALKDKIKTRFETWRAKRDELIQRRRTKAQELHTRMQELRQQRREIFKAAHQRRREYHQQLKEKRQELRHRRQENRQELRDKRQENRQELRDKRQENRQELRDKRQLNIQERQQNREKLIQMRSNTLKQKLDETRTKVRTHREDVVSNISP